MFIGTENESFSVALTLDKKSITNELLNDTNLYLDGSTISNGFIWINRFVQFLPIEEILQEFLNFRNSSRASDQDNVVNLYINI